MSNGVYQCGACLSVADDTNGCECRDDDAYAKRVRILDAVKAAANSAPSTAREMLLDAVAVLRGAS